MFHLQPPRPRRSLPGSVIVAALFCLFITSHTVVYSWEIHLDTWDDKLLSLPSGTILLLDPDEVSATEIHALRAKGITPLAWLNLGYREPGRSFSAHLEDRILSLSQKKPRTPRFPVRFFSAVWKRCLQQRVFELTNLGFQGLFLTGLEAAAEITDHPMAVDEMVQLCRFVRLRLEGLTSRPFVVIDVPLDYRGQIADLQFADRLCLQGIWYTNPRRGRRPWERKPLIDRLLRQTTVPILTVDWPPQSRRETVRSEITALGAEPCFTSLPLLTIRSRLP